MIFLNNDKLFLMSIKLVYENELGLGLEYLGPDAFAPLVKDFFIKVKNQIEEDLNNGSSN